MVLGFASFGMNTSNASASSLGILCAGDNVLFSFFPIFEFGNVHDLGDTQQFQSPIKEVVGFPNNTCNDIMMVALCGLEFLIQYLCLKLQSYTLQIGTLCPFNYSITEKGM